MSSEKLIERAQRLADAKHPFLARGGRLFDLVLEELRAGASDTDAVTRARRRLAEETDADGEPPERT